MRRWFRSILWWASAPPSPEKRLPDRTLLPHESISPLEALKSYTIDAAYAGFEEDSKGSVSPGKLADLVVLSDDPRTVPPEEIKDIQVITTILDGKVVWQK